MGVAFPTHASALLPAALERIPVRFRPAIAIATVLTVTMLSACTGGAEPTPSRTVLDLDVTGTVGITLPAGEGSRYLEAGSAIETLLTTWGATVDLRYSGPDPADQADQITAMVDAGADLLIVTPVQADALAQPLAAAREAGVPVIAYDRLIRDTPDVDYYVGFDRFGIGVQVGWAALSGLGLGDLNGDPTGALPDEPYPLEVFAGDLAAPDFYYGYNGTVRQVLELSAEQGSTTFGSGQSAPDAVATTDARSAAARMTQLLQTVYTEGVSLRAVTTAGDDIAAAVIASLRDHGLSPGSDQWPVVVGVGATTEGLRAIESGEQYATILTDDRLVHEAAAYLAASVLLGEQLDSLNVKDYDNGARTVPALLVPGTIVTADNLQATIIDSGYASRSEIG